ncbi:hypothetical protein FHX42_002650 [Saccharopolyspora lacisalsi]|uniref:Uncharacterized protein n=1 Tax=Halosaccharopolyspora lacisalsi TaxID=1000566 RepID=A0A839DX28_9PSEU|nr:hypothetical protein [Halosaccharopolyspora lacisalsi]
MMNGSHAATVLLVGVAATGLAAPTTGLAASGLFALQLT